MDKRVLVKKNVFTSVAFGAMLLFAIAMTAMPFDGLSVVSGVIAAFVLLLSIAKLCADILESINDRLTRSLRSSEKAWGAGELKPLRSLDDEACETLISEIVKKKNRGQNATNELRSYRKAALLREKIRLWRRGFLYAYYALFMFLLFSLFWHAELAQLLSSGGMVSVFSPEVITLWSLVVVLAEIMMKDIVVEMAACLIDSKIGTHLNWWS